MKRAIIYARVSTDDQAQNGVSMENQVDRCRKYCELNDLVPFEVISDPGKSGKDLKRPGIKEVIELCQQQTINTVVVYKLDRLSRSLRDILDLIEDTFDANGIELHSINENLNTSNPMGKFFVHMIGALSELERDMISFRTKDALRKLKANGANLGQTSYGLRKVDLYTVEIAPDEYRILDYARYLQQNLKLGYKEIATALNHRGMRTRYNKEFSKETVRKMLKSEAYTI